MFLETPRSIDEVNMPQKERAATETLKPKLVKDILFRPAGLYGLLISLIKMSDRFSATKTTNGYNHA